MNTLEREALLPGWNDAVHDAQATFRCVLKALSEPGSVRTMPVSVEAPPPLDTATAAICLALVDFETALWLDRAIRTPAVESWLRFHCGCPLVDNPADANFVVIADVGAPLRLDGFAQGTPEYPDRSTTLLIQVPTLKQGPSRTLSGPGIANVRVMNVGRLPENFDEQWRANGARFPLGVDIVFCSDNAIVGLPRTTIFR